MLEVKSHRLASRLESIGISARRLALPHDVALAKLRNRGPVLLPAKALIVPQEAVERATAAWRTYTGRAQQMPYRKEA